MTKDKCMTKSDFVRYLMYCVLPQFDFKYLLTYISEEIWIGQKDLKWLDDSR